MRGAAPPVAACVAVGCDAAPAVTVPDEGDCELETELVELFESELDDSFVEEIFLNTRLIEDT